MPVDLLIRAGRLVTPDGVRQADLAIDAGRIVAIDESPSATTEIDATGLHVFPGLVDPHVHFNAPGRDHWEGLDSGPNALAAGGGTCFIDMPLNSTPPVLTPQAFDAKVSLAAKKSRTDFALFAGLTSQSLDHLDALADRGVAGFKAFMSNSGIDDFPAADDHTLHHGMQRAAALNLPVLVHAENDTLTTRLAEQARQRGDTSWDAWTNSRPVIAELEAVQRAITLAADTGCSLHVVHVTHPRVVELIHEAAARYHVDVTCETCPHYLALTADDLPRLAGRAKCAPPLRSPDAVAGLWQDLADGKLAFVASDHSPAPASMKTADDAFAAWGGIAGVQSTRSILLTHDPRLPLTDIARLTSAAPAARFRLPNKGILATGNDADLALVDLDHRFTLTQDALHDRHKLSPYVGQTFRGHTVRTLVRGHTVFLNGQPVGDPVGRLVKPARIGHD